LKYEEERWRYGITFLKNCSKEKFIFVFDSLK
jgi:hypothetical protein